jgi:hypothetical protein
MFPLVNYNGKVISKLLRYTSDVKMKFHIFLTMTRYEDDQSASSHNICICPSEKEYLVSNG